MHLQNRLESILNDKFHIAVRIRKLRDGNGLRLYQLATPKNRHLVDVRPVEALPATESIDGVLVATPVELLVGNVISCVRRKGKPKSFTNRRDLAHMLLKFPEFKVVGGLVEQRLQDHGAEDDIIAFWHELVDEEIHAEDDESY